MALPALAARRAQSKRYLFALAEGADEALSPPQSQQRPRSGAATARKNLIATHIGEIGVLIAEIQDEARTHRRDLRGLRGTLLR